MAPKLQRLTVTVEATATIEEEWTLDVTPAWARRIAADPRVALDIIEAGSAVVSVADRVTGDETDREVKSVEVQS
jgi:hypothetical protein